MPYYVFRISQGPTAIVKNLDLLNEFDSYKEAKNFARDERANQATDEGSQVKVMFADNRLQAEEQLMEKREEPILREWEK
jgi:hypothetical protein